MKKITILIPCHNEEKGIVKVIDSIPIMSLQNAGYETDIIVIDNNSTDKTAQIAHSKGAVVLFAEKKGKGNAIRTGFNYISPDTDYIIMLDGDNTYKANEIPRLIEPLENNFCDVVIGSRLSGKLIRHSLRLRNRAANWVYTFLVRHFYHANTTDVLSGYFAWKKEVIDQLKDCIYADGFSIEMEMITKMVKLGFEVYSVPITYDIREGESKIQSISDGSKILYTFFVNLFWTPSKRTKKYTKLHLETSR